MYLSIEKNSRLFTSITLVLLCFFVFSNSTFAQSFSGSYSGPVDGGKGELIIEQIGNIINLKLTVGGAGCAGEIKSSGKLQGNKAVLVKKEDDQECILTINFKNDGVKIEEESCSNFHSFSCSFSSYKGVFKRVKK